jgi:hypothetical protein
MLFLLIKESLTLKKAFFTLVFPIELTYFGDNHFVRNWSKI